MTRRTLVTTVVAAIALVAPTSALAKGASEATITGPGLGAGIRLVGEGRPGGERLMQLAEDAGFFPSVFATSPNPMLSSQPRGELGPRYTIVYVMPGPTGSDLVRQDVYPYAMPSPVTHMDPGQSFYGGEKTVGGWYVAGTALKDDLVAVGLPATAPANGGDEATAPAQTPDPLAAAVASGRVALVLAVLRRLHVAADSLFG
jgi:hypothetical protein